MKFIQKKYLEAAIHIVNAAEREITGTRRGADRMAVCISKLRDILPPWVSIFITDEAIRALLQLAFDLARESIQAAET